MSTRPHSYVSTRTPATVAPWTGTDRSGRPLPDPQRGANQPWITADVRCYWPARGDREEAAAALREAYETTLGQLHDYFDFLEAQRSATPEHP